MTAIMVCGKCGVENPYWMEYEHRCGEEICKRCRLPVDPDPEPDRYGGTCYCATLDFSGEPRGLNEICRPLDAAFDGDEQWFAALGEEAGGE